MFSPEQTAFANGARVAHLATSSADNHPHAVPITFVLLDGAVYFAVDEKPKRTRRLKRLQNIEENPNVALVIDRYDEDWSRLGWLMVHGKAAIVHDSDDRSRIISALRQKYSQYRDMPLEGPIVRITPSKVLDWGDIG